MAISQYLSSYGGIPAATSKASNAAVDGKLRQRVNAFFWTVSSFFKSDCETVCHTKHPYSKMGLILILIMLVVMYRGGSGRGVGRGVKREGGHRSEGQGKWEAGLGKTRIVLFNQVVLADSYSC